MPNDQGTVVDNDPQPTVASPDGAGENKQVPDPAAAEQSDKPYVGTYKTRDEAERGLAEKEKKLRQLQSELDKQKNANKQLELMQKMVETQAKLVENRGGKSEDEVKEYWRKRFEDDPSEAIWEFNQTVEAERDAAYKRELEQLRAEHRAELARLGQTVKQYDPDVVKYGEKANELAEQLGVELTDDNRELFIKFAKSQSKPTHPERPDFAGTTATPAVAASHQPKLSAATLAFVESLPEIGQLSKEERAALEQRLEANRAARAKREARA